MVILRSHIVNAWVSAIASRSLGRSPSYGIGLGWLNVVATGRLGGNRSSIRYNSLSNDGRRGTGMTLQELLDEARRLTWRDQIYLATQLLAWVQQRVNSNEQAIAPTSEEMKRGNVNDLMLNPLPVRHFKPLNREEIYERS